MQRKGNCIGISSRLSCRTNWFLCGLRGLLVSGLGGRHCIHRTTSIITKHNDNTSERILSVSWSEEGTEVYALLPVQEALPEGSLFYNLKVNVNLKQLNKTLQISTTWKRKHYTRLGHRNAYRHVIDAPLIEFGNTHRFSLFWFFFWFEEHLSQCFIRNMIFSTKAAMTKLEWKEETKGKYKNKVLECFSLLVLCFVSSYRCRKSRTR